MEDNQQRGLIQLDLSHDYFLTHEIEGLENTVIEAARNTVAEFARGQGVSLTDTELEAIVTVQVMKELNSVDLASLLLRTSLQHRMKSLKNLFTWGFHGDRAVLRFLMCIELTIHSWIDSRYFLRSLDLLK